MQYGPHSQASVRLVEQDAGAHPLAPLPASPEHYYPVWQPLAWEIVSVLTTIVIAISNFVILLHYDGQLAPDWGSYMNLTTLLALLATVFRACLTFCLSNMISQSKWWWYRGQARRLRHLESFDSGK